MTKWRIAKNSKGHYYEVPSDMTYKKWWNSLENDEKGRMRILQKMDKNKSADKKQLNNYKDILGKETPSINKYQDMKYNKSREYELLNQYKKAVKAGHINVLTGFKNYKKIDKQITERLHGITMTNGMTIESHSLHFIDRVIGEHSYSEGGIKGKRKGVNLKDIERTLKESTEFGKIRVNSKGERSYVIYGEKVTISFNQDTNTLIQVQPRG